MPEFEVSYDGSIPVHIEAEDEEAAIDKFIRRARERDQHTTYDEELASASRIETDGGEEISPMSMATETQKEISQYLGSSEGGVEVMSFGGPAGQSTFIGKGATLENQVKPALMGAISQMLNEHVWVDEPSDPQEVQNTLQRQLRSIMDPFEAENLALETADTLRSWSDYHGDDDDQS